MDTEEKFLITREVSADEGGVRLDKCLRLWVPKLPQSLIQKTARKGLLQLNGQKAKPSDPVKPGEFLSFPKFFTTLIPQRSPVSPPGLTKKERTWLKSLIIYEDDEIIALNKPSGAAVQKGTGIQKSLDTMMVMNYPSSPPRLVHRLDRETSGILIFARSLPMARWLTQAFKDRKVQKTYWALVRGLPEKQEGTISLALSKKGEKIYVNQDTGLSATTQFRVLKTSPRHITWLELKPITGRTHQLRIHCKEGLNTPILGDKKYGGKDALPFGRSTLYLHARSLSLPLPNGQFLTLEAPLPQSFQEQLENL